MKGGEECVSACSAFLCGKAERKNEVQPEFQKVSDLLDSVGQWGFFWEALDSVQDGIICKLHYHCRVMSTKIPFAKTAQWRFGLI